MDRLALRPQEEACTIRARVLQVQQLQLREAEQHEQCELVWQRAYGASCHGPARVPPEQQQQLREMAQRELQELRLQRHLAASEKLHREYAARRTIDHWLRCWIDRCRWAKLRARCTGASSHARRVRAASVLKTWYRRTRWRALMARAAAYLRSLPTDRRSIRVVMVSGRPLAPAVVAVPTPARSKKNNFSSLDCRDNRRVLTDLSTPA